MLEEFDGDVLDGFTSDDGLHVVEWMYYEELGYETWVCVTHQSPYYLSCVNDGGIFFIVEN